MKKIEVIIHRGVNDRKKEEKYFVPYEEKIRVLGVMRYIQEHIDGTLAFRWNCGEGICGSCAIELNGKPILACKTEITENMERVYLGPLKAFPVIKDFVYDRSLADNELQKIKPYFVTKNKKKGFWEMYESDVKDAAEMRTCINCLICHDSCHVLRDTNLKFLGPMTIVKAAGLEKHPMNGINRAPLLNKLGINSCNVTRCCTDNCPQGIQITQNAIIPFKEKIISDFIPLKSLFKRK